MQLGLSSLADASGYDFGVGRKGQNEPSPSLSQAKAQCCSNDLKSQVVDLAKDPSLVHEKRFLLQGSLTRSTTNATRSTTNFRSASR